MYEEWFEKLAKQYEIVEVKQTRNSIELYFSPEISNKIDGEKLFMDAYEITRMFRFQMKSNHLIVILDTIKLEDHYLKYLTKLISGIKLKADNID